MYNDCGSDSILVFRDFQAQRVGCENEKTKVYISCTVVIVAVEVILSCECYAIRNYLCTRTKAN